MPYVVVFIVFNVLRREVVVRFVDIGGIVEIHCLNFLFIFRHFCGSDKIKQTCFGSFSS